MIDILIVDDENTIREGISKSINWVKYEINVCGTAKDGSEALDLIENFMPSIVISDISMKDMDGLELLEIINQVYPNIKVILISGYKDFEYAQKAVAFNAFAYITKPIDTDILVDKVLDAKKQIDKRLTEIKINDSIRKKLRENILILKDNFFRVLLEGKIRNKQDIMERADMLEISLSYKQFITCVLEYESNNVMQKKSIYDQSFYKAAIMSYVEEKLSEIFTCYSFNLDNRIGIIVCGDDINKELLIRRLNLVRDWVNENMGMILTVGVGSLCGNIERIALSNRTANDAIQYRVILGKNVVIDSDQKFETTKEKIAIEDFDSTLKNNEDDIIYALKNGDKVNVKKISDSIIESVSLVISNDIRQKERITFLLAFYLVKIIYTLEIHKHRYYGNENELYSYLNTLQTLDKIKKFINSFMDEIISEMNTKKNSRNSFLVNKALKYIKDNIYDNISLVSIAEKLQ
ncbi:MAG: response regulator, partial [Clostridia bacterium]|nr:response regulator [Clostridia bacterium]